VYNKYDADQGKLLRKELVRLRGRERERGKKSRNNETEISVRGMVGERAKES
jgi:hypothetical protein